MRTDWSRQPLGEIPDRELAARLGLTIQAVAMARRRRGISAPVGQPMKKAIDWDSQPLGLIPDRELARLLGCTSPAVYYARRQRGIPPLKSIAPKCDPSVFLSELDGTVHDYEVAARHGLSAQQVARARRRAGLPSGRNDWDTIELAKEPDIAIAKRLGVDNKVVAQARWRRGIGKWEEKRICPCGAIYIAHHRRQRYCGYNCQRYHWQLVHKKGLAPEIADLRLALRAYKRSMRYKGKPNVEVVG